MTAIIFPTAPTDGQEYTDNNGVVWVWKAIGTSGGKWGRKPVAGGGSITNAAVNTAIAANTTATITALNASAGGGGSGDDGKLVKFGANSLRTGVGGGITTAAADSGNNGGYISTSLFGWISTSESGFIQTSSGGHILTGGTGFIETGINGSIQTGFEGYIRTGENAPISTYGGGSIITGNGSISTGNGSFTTGEGNLTGPNGSGTIALTSNIPTVDATIINDSANAVSGNAVFDALALKAPIASPTFTGTVTTAALTTGGLVNFGDGTSVVMSTGAEIGFRAELQLGNTDNVTFGNVTTTGLNTSGPVNFGSETSVTMSTGTVFSFRAALQLGYTNNVTFANVTATNVTATAISASGAVTIGNGTAITTSGITGALLVAAANATAALTELGYVTKEKTGNGTAVINITRIADNHLTGWSLDANSTYEVTGSLWCFADTGGMRVTLEFSQALDSRYADTAAGFGTASAPDAGVNAAISKLSGVNELLLLDRTNPIDSECATIFLRFRTGTSAPTAQFKYAQRTATNNLGAFLLTSSIVSIRKVSA